MAPDESIIVPRFLIVSRRTVRKKKFVDFVGEYHLDLIVKYGAAPVIVPRVSGIDMLLKSYEPIHGVLLCEGQDIHPSLYEAEHESSFSQEELKEIKQSHASDSDIDREKDSIELKLVTICLERNIPYLGICRGSQILNAACGGTLYQDIEKQLFSKNGVVRHVDYDNYDGHRHVVRVVENTPLREWFRDSIRGGEICVNSYHHQGVKRLAERFVAMAFAPDGLVEGFYDAGAYDPEGGKFAVGLQFHPERMRDQESGDFDYPGCEAVYKDFVKAVIAYEKRLSSSRNEMKGVKADCELETKGLKVDRELKTKRNSFVRSFSVARINNKEFLQANMALSLQEEKRLKQMGATVRNASTYITKLRTSDEREKAVGDIRGKMSIEELSDIVSLYQVLRGSLRA